MPHIDTSGFSECRQCGGSEHRHRKGRRLSQSRNTKTNDSHMLLGDEKAGNTFAFSVGKNKLRRPSSAKKYRANPQDNGYAEGEWRGSEKLDEHSST